MTLPASIPQFRHPPDTERFIAKSGSSQIIKSDDRSFKRNADQVAFLTSGEIGSHYFIKETAASKFKSTNLADSARTETARIEKESARKEEVTSGRQTMVAAKNAMHQTQQAKIDANFTLQSFSGTFDRRSKRDWQLATMGSPKKSHSEIIGYATDIHQSALQSKSWALKLRHGD